jgi:hypothetical protein
VFSKTLELDKEDIANLTEKEMTELQGGSATWTRSGCCDNGTTRNSCKIIVCTTNIPKEI